MGVWLYFFGQENAFSQRKTCESLKEAGLTVYITNSNTPTGSGVIFFDEVTQQLFEFLRDLSRSSFDRVLAIAMSGSALTSNKVWQLLQAGASDVFAWGHSTNPAGEVAARFEHWNKIDHLVCSPTVRENLIGQSPIWITVMREIVEMAHFTDASILIMGESGTGKELIARLIHSLDSRSKKGEMIILDCTTIVPELSGSEFFGHDRGAFTGAVVDREGAFALANKGTLFLDEVGELPLPLQAELLRVIQERTYKRVGSNAWRRSDFRLICATNKELHHAVTQGEFRRDLYYRIATCTCKLPPLRGHPEDILPITQHFIKQLRPNEEPPALDDAVCEYLLRRQYPGNVRDLKQLVSRIMYRHVGPGPVTVGDIPEEERPSTEYEIADWRNEAFENAIRFAISLGIGLKEIRHEAENTAIRIAVCAENGNLQLAAHKLGITDRALQMRQAAHRKMHELSNMIR